jgi:hypothetical protein
MKGILYASKSRFVSLKLELGWIYNSVSVVLFQLLWKMQSDVWGIHINASVPFDKLGHHLSCKHISAGDFSVNSSTIFLWLSNFLWAKQAQLINHLLPPFPYMGSCWHILYGHFTSKIT